MVLYVGLQVCSIILFYHKNKINIHTSSQASVATAVSGLLPLRLQVTFIPHQSPQCLLIWEMPIIITLLSFCPANIGSPSKPTTSHGTHRVPHHRDRRHALIISQSWG